MRIRSYIWTECIRIQSECGKMWTRITPNAHTFHAVRVASITSKSKLSCRYASPSVLTPVRYKNHTEIYCSNVNNRPIWYKTCDGTGEITFIVPKLYLEIIYRNVALRNLTSLIIPKSVI